MTMPNEVDVVVSDTSGADDRSYVDWPAIFAGIAVATAISIVLLTFGSAIGLNFTNFTAADDVPVIWIAIAAAIWLLWVQVSSFMAGGYLTGRLRKRHHDANEDESDMRDGAHGVLVWAGALILGAFIAISGLGAASSAVGNIAGAITGGASNVAGDAMDSEVGLGPDQYFVDMLFRPGAATDTAMTDTADTAAAPAATDTTATPAVSATDPAVPASPGATTAPASPIAPATSSVADTDTAPATTTDMAALRAEAGRIFAQSALSDDGLPADDRTYLAQQVAANTTLTTAEAEARVDQVVTAIDNARAQAAEIAEETRRMTVLAAFLTAAAFLVSAVGAYWAAQKGGNHRDKNMAFPAVFRRW